MFDTDLYLSDLARFERVAYAVLQAGTPFCPQNRRYSLGEPPTAAADLPEDLRRGFAERFGATSAPLFLQVLPQSPAGLAGVRAGEELVSIRDQATGSALAAGWFFRRPPNTLVKNEPFEVTLGRGKAQRSIEVSAQLICNQQPRLVRQDELVAQIEDGNLTVSTGFLRFVRNDDELALVLSNELARSILPRRQDGAPSVRVAGDTSSAEDDRAADYLGTYLAVLAGFNAERSSPVWQRIAANPPSRRAGGLAHRHPFTAERAIWLQGTLAEIRHKTITGQRLTPERFLEPAQIELALAAAPGVQSAAPDPRLARVADVPFVSASGLGGYQRFLDSPLRPRAFAIAPGAGTWAFRTGGDAVNDALTACSRPTAPCYLYAVDERVVWNPETVVQTPSLRPASADGRIARVDEVPFIDAKGRAGYEQFLRLSVRPRAFAISPKAGGTAAWAYKSGPNASADALEHCAVLSRGRPCYLYAVNEEVVWALENAPESAIASTGIQTQPSRLRPPASSGFAQIDDLAAVPISHDQLARYQAFLEKPLPRAFVITQEGIGRYWLGAAAMTDALSYCERLAEPCWLYAVNADVVWREEKAMRISRRAQLSLLPEEDQFLNN